MSSARQQPASESRQDLAIKGLGGFLLACDATSDGRGQPVCESERPPRQALGGYGRHPSRKPGNTARSTAEEARLLAFSAEPHRPAANGEPVSPYRPQWRPA